MSNTFNDQVVFNNGTQTYGNSSVSGNISADKVSADKVSVGEISAGVVTATTFYGDGSNLTGLDVTVTQTNYSGYSQITTSGTVISIASTSNAYGSRYVSVGSTPSSNSVGNNGDIWYVV